MERLGIKRHIRILYLIVFFLFFLNKFQFRPWVLTNQTPYFLKVLVWSFPNFAEAVLGSTLITALLSILKIKWFPNAKSLKEPYIYLLSILLAGIFVLTQEVKWHNLGGRNVYDPNDFIASILGLLFMLGVFLNYGFRTNTRSDSK